MSASGPPIGAALAAPVSTTALVANMDNFMIATQIACLILWTFVLLPAGEKTSLEVGHRWDPAAAARLKDQLNAINAALLRMSRR